MSQLSNVFSNGQVECIGVLLKEEEVSSRSVETGEHVDGVGDGVVESVHDLDRRTSWVASTDEAQRVHELLSLRVEGARCAEELTAEL